MGRTHDYAWADHMSRRWRLLAGALLVFGLGGAVHAEDYSAGWGPAVGTTMPLLSAPDHAGAARTLDNLAGEQGLLLFLSRSADW